MLNFVSRIGKATAFFCVAFAGLWSGSAFGVVYVTLGGSQSSNYVGYQTFESRAGSASVALGLGDLMRVGLTHRQEFQYREGFFEDTEAPGTFGVFNSLSRVVSNSVDLTVILYAGDVFVPFVSAGGVRKLYINKVIVDRSGAVETDSSKQWGPIQPNLGVGLGIRLNQRFSLKLSYTVSPATTQMPGQEARAILDNFAEVGLTYQL
jgi:hypothetical protein